MFLLDTNTLIYFFRGDGNVIRHMLATPPNQIGVPVIAIYELEVGIAKSSSPQKRRKQLNELLRTTHVVPMDRRIAAEAAKIRAQLETAGTPIGPLDNLIAGAAVSIGAVLVTRNQSEFSRVPGLRTENWYD